MDLKVTRAAKEDIYRDIVRINEKFRVDRYDKVIAEGSVCRLEVSERATYALLRGLDDSEGPEICIDERLRNLLDVKIGYMIHAQLTKARWMGQFIWAWRSSDPAYRIAARLEAISVLLGMIGVLLGVLAILRG